MSKLTWQDTDRIAWALADANPSQDPLGLSFTKLRQLVLDLPDFEDSPNACNEAILESIQMAWYEEVK